MTQTLKIDFVSDVSCPWCVIGLASLEKALGNLAGEIDGGIAFHPFELNPAVPAGGENASEHIAAKYGMSAPQLRENRARIRDRAAEVGFTMTRRMRAASTTHSMRIA